MRLCWSKLHISISLQQRACIVIVTMRQRSAKRSLLVIVPLTPSSPSPHSPPHEFLHNRIVTNNQLITFHWLYNQPPRPRSTWCDQHKLGLTLCANSWLGHIWKDLFFFKIGLYHAGSVMDYVLVVPIKYNSRVFFHCTHYFKRASLISLKKRFFEKLDRVAVMTFREQVQKPFWMTASQHMLIWGHAMKCNWTTRWHN